MRVMISFRETNEVRFVSHLDMLRSTQRALMRSKLPLAYSQGYHPHPILSFAMALPVGSLSEREYMDITLTEYVEPVEITKRLNAGMPSGLSVVKSYELKKESKSLMSQVAASDWMYEARFDEDIEEKIKSLLNQDNIMIKKISKGKEKIIDIKPGIICVKYEDNRIIAKLAAGSKLNIQPSLLWKALFGEDNIDYKLTRLELYFENKSGLQSFGLLASEDI